MTDPKPDALFFSFAEVFPRLGETGTTEQIITLATARSA
jgi:hypothetical protein